MLATYLLLALLSSCLGAVLVWATLSRKLIELTHRHAQLTREKQELSKQLTDATTTGEQLRGQVTATQAEVENAVRAGERASQDALLRAKQEMWPEMESEARRRAENIAREWRDRAARAVAEAHRFSADVATREDRMFRREAILAQKEELVGQREVEISRREKVVADREHALQSLEAEARQTAETHRRSLEAHRVMEKESVERIARMTQVEARNKLQEEQLELARAAVARELRTIEEQAKEEADRRAKRILGIALQRYAGEYVAERAVTTVHLPNDDVKGRIIGREGRNIRSFQEATGVDLIVDDTPELIVISGFDPQRREVARLALEKLIQDGRIHPTRIEECVAQAQEEVANTSRDAAEAAVLELGVGRIHPELIKLLGALRYRYSYAQNVLRHCVEVGYIAGLLAAELGVSIKAARRAGLLHDVGKAVTHEMEGGHAIVGAQFARKYGEDEVISGAIGAHHEDEPARTLISQIVIAADAISGARPGARREMLETYVKRLEDLERIAAAFPGVEKAYALQAGRELRVLVDPGDVDDLASATLCREIARKVENDLAYPGQIRVTVVRETRAVDYAR